jgi:arylsulfatase
VAQILSAAGYDTAMLGKNHNVPTWQQSSLGPFTQWASGLGFNYFYGFHGGVTNQFQPTLIENNRMIEPPPTGDGSEKGYVFDRDMADHAIAWLREQHTQHPANPFLLYYAPGTAHAPLQAPAEWIARFKGRFDSGWDAYRDEVFARQKRMGIIPKDARLAPLPEGIRHWNQLSADERRVAARFMETYAAMLAYCDAQIGRIVEELKRSGQYDNTLVIFLQGDNGASGEGGELGSFDYAGRMGAENSSQEEVAHALANLDKIGGPESYVVGPVGWASAMNTPFPYYKLIASRLGGISNGMVVSWPAHLKERGLRTQFTHVTDVAPTILEAAGIEAPDTLGGVAQQPFDGVSFAYSFTQPRAPSRHHVQYFEVFGNAAIYRDGWMLAEPVRTDPRFAAAMPDTQGPWQLYDLNTDFSQTRDVAASHPDKVAELQALWQSEASRNHVLPMKPSNFASMLPGVRPEPVSEPGRHVFYPSANRYPEGVFPVINNRNWTIEADIGVPLGGAEGVLVTQGGRPSGWALAMLHGVPQFLFRATDRDSTLLRLTGRGALGAGKHRVTVTFTSDGPGIGRGGNFALQVDGEDAASGRVERTPPFKFAQEDATVGHDTGTSVTPDYRPPFAFTGTLNSVTFDLGPVQPVR